MEVLLIRAINLFFVFLEYMIFARIILSWVRIGYYRTYSGACERYGGQIPSGRRLWSGFLSYLCADPDETGADTADQRCADDLLI